MLGTGLKGYERGRGRDRQREVEREKSENRTTNFNYLVYLFVFQFDFIVDWKFIMTDSFEVKEIYYFKFVKKTTPQYY